MFIAHVLHGCLVLFVFVFGLPLILLMASAILANRRAPSTQSLRLLGHALHAIYKGVSGIAEAMAETLTQLFPSQHGWMKPLLKPSLTVALILAALYFISDCGY